ncbi:MAG: serine/threonine-protein kinase, partial [Polyangiaceae bacterium]
FDTLLGVRRVLKILEPGRSSAFDRRMLREWRMLAGLDHPNIVRVICAGRTTDFHQVPYYVMERLEGQDLRRWLRGGKFPIERAISITADVLAGLIAAHERQILHRDVKPENVFLRRSRECPWYEVKLLDFGCARWMHQPSSDALVGTLNYVAPELLDGAKASEKSDVYATGVTLYEMLTGRHPFGQLPISTRRGPPAPLSETIDAPGDLIELVDEALCPDPYNRIPTAREFAARLAEVRYRWDNRHLVAETTDLDALVAEKAPSTLRIPSAPPALDEDDESDEDESDDDESDDDDGPPSSK